MDGLALQVRLYCGGLVALSVFSALLLLWLGVTVLLNAERRTGGVLLVGLGAIAAGLFFLTHAIIAAESVEGSYQSPGPWWPVGWVALILAPYAWYIAALWHSGYWESGGSRLRREHRLLVFLSTLFSVAILAFLSVTRPVPSPMRLLGVYFVTTPTIFGIPGLVLLYPLFMAFCTCSSLFALQRPGPTGYVMQGPARSRARPWLLGATGCLLSVSLLMVLLLLWLVLYGGPNYLQMILDQPPLEAFWMDLTVNLPIVVAVILIGQAVVSYEIFTGKALPRRVLRSQWHYALVLAGGYSVAVGAGYALQFPTISVVVVTTTFLALALAVFGWRSHRERQRHFGALRSLVASEHSFGTLLGADASKSAQTPAPFAVLCRDVLGARVAYLIPAGSISTLVQRPLTYPENAGCPADATSVVNEFTSPEITSLALDPERWGGAIWAVPLWSARGLAGVFLLGEKSDAGLYSQEEIEIARSGGERLLDTLAVVSLARRLMLLQRQRYVETQVIDQQSRRALHDEVLPSLHAIMLSLQVAGVDESTAGALAQLGQVHRRLSALLREMPTGRASQVAELGLLGALRGMVSDEFSRDFDKVSWQIEPEAEERARSLPSLTADIVYYAAKEVIRNAARHGRGSNPAGPLSLAVEAVWRGGLELRILDDGVGLAGAQPGSAAGQGMALHGAMLAVIGASLEVSDGPSAGTTATIALPDGMWPEG
jgi:signal transduction histidine kinase